MEFANLYFGGCQFYILEGANLHFGGCQFTFCRCFIEKVGNPKKGVLWVFAISDYQITHFLL